MKEFVAETLQVLLPARMPGTRSDRNCNGRAPAFRCALLALLVLGLLRGIGQAQEPLTQEPLKIESNGWVSIPKTLAVGGDETGKLRYHLMWRSGGLDLAETQVADDRLFIQAGTGYVGIGTHDPKQNLAVAGTGFFSGNVGIGKEPTTDKLSVDGKLTTDSATVTRLLSAGTLKAGALEADSTSATVTGSVTANGLIIKGNAQIETINGNRPPLSFRIPYGHAAVRDVRELCKAPNGCGIRLMMRHKNGTFNFALYDLRIGTDSGTTGQDIDESRRSWPLSHNSGAPPIVFKYSDWCWAEIRGKDGGAVYFACHPHVTAMIDIYAYSNPENP